MKELEFKFLLSGKPEFNYVSSVWVRQVYLIVTEFEELRVKAVDGLKAPSVFRSFGQDLVYFLTVKKGRGEEREEFELEISENSFLDLEKLGIGSIEKTRYITGSGWEIDVYSGKWEGLILAEKEFQGRQDKDYLYLTEDIEGRLPEEIKKVLIQDVTKDERFKNKSLATTALNFDDLSVIYSG